MPLKKVAFSLFCGYFLLYAPVLQSQCSAGASVSGSYSLVSGSGNGTPASPFSPGSVIRITLNIGGTYSQNGNNWWHGVQINLGSNFTFASPLNLNINNFPANSRWIWSNGHTGNGPGASGPGVYYDADNDGNPANNYGRNTTNLTGTISFNVVAGNTPTNSGTISTNIMSDGFSGSWATTICDGDAAPVAAITVFNNIVLPATLISLKAKLLGNKNVEIIWETATEDNVSHFIVQHSTEGRTWSDIGTQPAAGNSSILRSYTFIHNNPSGSDHLYRIKTVDRDGRFEYSKVVSLKKEFVSEILYEKIYPNPFNDKLSLRIVSPNHNSGQLVIYNGSGAKIVSLNIELTKGLNEFSINTGLWQKGIYMIRFVNDNTSITEKVIKN